MMNTIMNRVRGMVGRCVLNLVDDARKMQSLQVQRFAGQVPDDVERFQNYGMSSHPHPGAEGIAVEVAGSAGHPVVIVMDDRRYRVTDLAEGEVCLYTDEDGNNDEHRIHFKRGKIIEIKAGVSSIVMTPAGITIRTPNLQLIKV